ncbi:MAG: hypothetical protein HC773_02785 [Scytonema sp. CRU_2_7]|nr:hypothetical protein [Scytonema sp. CRU_2_7]
MRKAGKQATVFADNPTLLKEVMRISAYQEEPSLGADPFYVHLLAEDAADGRLTPANIATQPKGLNKYLSAWWRKIEESEEDNEPLEDLFGTLTVALGSIPRADLETINSSLVSKKKRNFFHKILEQVRRWIVGNEVKGYALVHPRLRDYICTEIYTDELLEDYREKLLTFCASWQEHCSFYALRYYAEHLRDAKQWNELYELAQNQAFADAQRQQLPDEPELPLKNIRIGLQTAAERDDAGAIAKFLLIHAKQLLVQQSPLEALRTGSLEKAWKIADWCDVEYRILWYLLLAWELKDTGHLAEARETLKRLQESELRNFPGYDGASWQGDYAVFFFKHLFDVSEDICTVLCHQLLREFYLHYLCNLFTQNGNFPAALKTVEGISPEIKQVRSLINIAKAQANQGDKEAAQNILCKSLQIIRAFSDDNVYVFQMELIAEAQIKQLSDVEAAKNTLTELMKIADTISNQYQKVRVFLYIANFQVDLEMSHEALKTLEKVDTLPGRGDFFQDIAQVLYNAGEKEKARTKFAIAKKTACDIEDKNKRANTFREIAAAQTQVKNFIAALETAEEIEDEYHQTQALEAIAIAQAEVRDFTSALATANKIKDQTKKINTLWQIAQAQVELGKFTDALETANTITSESIQDDILVRVVTAQAEAGNIPAALINKNHIQMKVHKIKLYLQ